jgi:peptidoglycan hydrolase CwlO-like protein
LSRIHRDEDSLTSRVLPIEFVRSLAEAGPASTLIAASLGAGVVLWSNQDIKNSTRQEVKSVEAKIEGKINNIEGRINNIEGKINNIEGKINNIEGKIDHLSEEVQHCQSMILETAYHTMRGLDGNKTPMREWIQKIERCRASGEDC